MEPTTTTTSLSLASVAATVAVATVTYKVASLATDIAANYIAEMLEKKKEEGQKKK